MPVREMIEAIAGARCPPAADLTTALKLKSDDDALGHPRGTPSDADATRNIRRSTQATGSGARMGSIACLYPNRPTGCDCQPLVSLNLNGVVKLGNTAR